MHKESIELLEQAVDHYFPQHGLVYDIGSLNINGTYRESMESRGWQYIGLDIVEGNNVDFVIPETGSWKSNILPLADLIISGQCLEHVKRPWEWILQANELGKDNSGIIIIAPFVIGVHKYPIDCWRFLPDGMQVLFDIGGFKMLDSQIVGRECIAIGIKESIT